VAVLTSPLADAEEFGEWLAALTVLTEQGDRPAFDVMIDHAVIADNGDRGVTVSISASRTGAGRQLPWARAVARASEIGCRLEPHAHGITFIWPS
jgi:hypothetical protein